MLIRTPVRSLLREDHRRLEDLYEKLLAAFEADAREDTQRYWSELDAQLERHMQAEETYLFPVLRRRDAREAEALQAEHRVIRRDLAELGAGVDLKLVRNDIARHFIEDLRLHAAREDLSLYRLADRLPGLRKGALVRRLGGAPSAGYPVGSGKTQPRWDQPAP